MAEFAKVVDQFSDQLWRLNNLYIITDEHGRRVTFNMHDAQRQLFDEMHNLNVILKARQRGFTTFIQLFMLDACVFNSDVRAGTIAHTLPDAQVIFRDKIRFPYDNLPEGIKGIVPPLNDNTTELLLANNSGVRVSTSLRSGTLQYLHVSEYGKICAKFPDKAREVKSGALNTVDKDQIVFIESTAEGQDGHFFEICQAARTRKNTGDKLTPMDFKFHFSPWWEDRKYSLAAGAVEITPSYAEYFAKLKGLGVNLTPDQQAWYVKKAEQQQGDMKREFPSTPDEAFEAAIEGAYYSDHLTRMEMDRRLTRLPIDTGIPVMTSWDLGWNDTNSVWLIQVVGREIRWIDYYENNGYEISHYVNEINKRKSQHGFTFGAHYFPHDVTNNQLNNGKSVFDTLIGLGINPERVPRVSNVNDGINATRRMMGQSLIDPVRCEQGLKCLRNYRKEWDEDRACFRDKPYHNWASNGADAFRNFAQGYVEPTIVQPRQRYSSRSNSGGGSWQSA
ncbi:terminase [Tardiphaga sp. 841_E9_N1_2]|uniref:terminase n=1 Tax=Tardiphaga sp. 841_E9_N1_2 TaxID=3240762 RepID=UPI003F24139D